MLSSLVSLLQLIVNNNEAVRSVIARNEQYNHWHIPAHVVFRAKAYITQIQNDNVEVRQPSGIQIGILANELSPLDSLALCLMCIQSGHSVQLKFQQESPLASWLYSEWGKLSPGLSSWITVTSSSLASCQRIIVPAASNVPQLPGRQVFQLPNIRAVAQLSGNESDDELFLLCSDILTYFGRAELNVGLLLTPDEYNFEPLLRQAEKFIDLRQVNVYSNHFEYQRFTLLLNLKQHLDNNVILLLNDSQVVPRTGVVNHATRSQFVNLPIHCVLYTASGKDSHSLPFGSLAHKAWWPNPDLLAFLK